MKRFFTRYLPVLFIGFFAGYYSALILGQQQISVTNTREKHFQIRTEEYQPSCAELQNISTPSISTKGADHFIVITGKNDFIVFGLNSEADTSPMTFWWRSQLKNALQQSCQ